MAQCAMNHFLFISHWKFVKILCLFLFVCKYCLGPIEFQIQFTYTFQTHVYAITSNITVFVTDVNDNIPAFLSSPYSFSFTEDLTPSLIGFVAAFDRDSNPFNCIGEKINHIFTPLFSLYTLC